MINRTIRQIDSDKQVTMDVSPKQQGYALQRLIHSLIREYGKMFDTYHVNFNDLAFYDQKIFLSYVTDSGEYEDALESDARTRAYIEEYKKYMQELLDENCDEVYVEVMEEMGMRSSRYSNNNDRVWSKY